MQLSLRVGLLIVILAMAGIVLQPKIASSQVQKAARVSISVSSADGGLVDNSSDSPNYRIELVSVAGDVRHSVYTSALTDKKIWKLDTNFEEGETATLRLVRRQHERDYLEASQSIVVFSGTTFYMTAATKPAESITIEATAANGAVIDHVKDSPNYTVQVSTPDGKVWNSINTYQLNDKHGWLMNPDFVEGEEATLTLVRSHRGASVTEASKKVSLSSGTTYSLYSQTRAAESVTIKATAADGSVIDQPMNSPNYTLEVSTPDGKVWHSTSTYQLSDKKTWTLNPDFVEGEEATITLVLRRRGASVTETSQRVSLAGGVTYSLYSQTRAAENITIEATAAGGSVIDYFKDSPNYTMEVSTPDGKVWNSTNTYQLSDKKTWTLNPDFVEGEEATLALVLKRRGASTAEASKKVPISSSTTYSLLSQTRAAEGITVEATAAGGSVIDYFKDSPNYTMEVSTPDGKVWHSTSTYQLNDKKRWALNPDFVEGEDATLALVLKRRGASVTEASQKVSLTSGATYSLFSQTRAAGSITIEATAADGSVIDQARDSPNYTVELSTPDGKVWNSINTYQLNDKKTWTLNPDFVEGEDATLALVIKRRGASVTETSQKVSLSSSGATYSLYSRTRAAGSITIEATAADGSVIDQAKDSPNYTVEISTPDGKVWNSTNTYQLNDRKTWTLNPDFVEGEGATLALVIKRRGASTAETSQKVSLTSGATYSLLSQTRAAGSITIEATTADGSVIDHSGDLPNYRILISTPERAAISAKFTWQLSDGLSWVVNPDLTEGEKATIQLVRVHGDREEGETSQTVPIASNAKYKLTGKTVPAEGISVVVAAPDGGVVDTSSDYPNYTVELLSAEGKQRQSRETWRLQDGKLWAFNPDFVVGEKAVVKLTLQHRDGRVEEVSQAVTMSSKTTYDVRSKTRAAEGITVVVSAPDGSVVDTSNDRPNYIVELLSAEGKVRHQGETWKFQDGKLWAFNPDFVVGEQAVVRFSKLEAGGTAQTLVRAKLLAKDHMGIALTPVSMVSFYFAQSALAVAPGEEATYDFIYGGQGDAPPKITLRIESRPTNPNLSLQLTSSELSLGGAGNLKVVTRPITPAVQYELVLSGSADRLPELMAKAQLTVGVPPERGMVIQVTGDIDRDGSTDDKDLSLLTKAYGARAAEAGFSPNADLNSDKVIDYKDLAILAAALHPR